MADPADKLTGLGLLLCERLGGRAGARRWIGAVHARGQRAEQPAASDLVALGIPLHKYRTLNPGELVGRIAIDAMNYWAPVAGVSNAGPLAAGRSFEPATEIFTGSHTANQLRALIQKARPLAVAA